jgi:hypothetical protein
VNLQRPLELRCTFVVTARLTPHIGAVSLLHLNAVLGGSDIFI